MLVAAHELDVDSGSEQVYNAMDCCITHEVFSTLQRQIGEAYPAYGFELALQAPVLEMMLRGFRVDPGARELGIESTKAGLARLEHIIQTYANAVWDKDINPNSGAQLKDLFYNHLGIVPIKQWQKGELKFPMDRKVIEKIDDYFQARPITSAILAYRDLDKQLQILETEVDSDWRMRTSYNIGGTKSARFSSSKSPTGSGGNLQNVTESLRHIFIADPGFILCGIDAEQSDSRMVGFMCGVLFDDWSYLDACESGDLHTSVARLVWDHLPWTGDLKRDRKIAEGIFYRHFSYRDACKRIGHGANFLGKAPTLSTETHVPINLIKQFLERYFDRFSCILKWQAWTASQLQINKQLVSIHGRKRDFFDRTDADETVRKALAFLAAAATADNLNLGMWKIWRYMPEVQLLAQVHDAVYFQFPETLDKREIVAKAQDLLTLPITAANQRRFVVPTDVKLGYNWGNYVYPDVERGIPEKNPKRFEEVYRLIIAYEESRAVLDWIDEYVEATKLVPSPELYRRWSAITAISGALERKVWTTGSAGDIYPNLFTVLVGPPASGKDNAIRPIRELWAKINLLNLAPDNVTKASLIDVLSRSMRTVMNGSATPYIFSALSVPAPEFGVFFTHHDTEFLSVLNHIWGSPPSYREERRTAGIIEVNKPHLVLLAGTQPDYLNGFLPEEAWGMGFTSRLIFIYSGEHPKADLFALQAQQSSTLLPGLKKIFDLKGEFVWSKNAIDELNAWHHANGPPTPTHSKLAHYNGRRSLHVLKLSMISSVSRSLELHVTVDDVERARDWLLEAEKVMPDIFRAMGQKSDVQILTDMHYHLYRLWSSVAVEKRKPLTDKDVYEFLHSRAPSERIPRLIDTAVKTGYIRKGTYPDEWIPENMTRFGTVA